MKAKISALLDSADASAVRYRARRQYPDAPGDSGWAKWHEIIDRGDNDRLVLASVPDSDVIDITDALNEAYEAGKETAALRMYLWRDVLHNYTAGMAFAIAASADEARGMLIRDVGHSGEDFSKEPEIHELTEPFAAHVLGGG